MQELLKRYRLLLVVIVLILLGLHLASSALNRGDETGWFGRAVITVYSPIHSVIAWPFVKAAHLIHGYIVLVGVQAENDRLHRQNDALLTQVTQLSEVSTENERLMALLNFKPPAKVQPIFARVLARSTSPEFRTLLIDKGTDDGVERKMIAVAPAGLVGHVNAVTSNAAKILLITDAASVVDSLVQRTRAAGLVRGRSQSTCSFDFLARGEDIEVGDTVVTSGIGGVFTAGHIVGRVTAVDHEASEMFQNVEVTPTVQFENIEEIIILPGAPPAPDVVSPLENGKD